MLILSLDIETTSIDPEKGQLLSLGAVLHCTDTNKTLVKFHGAINHGIFMGEPYALHMNSELLKNIHNGEIEGGRVYDSFEDLLSYLERSLEEPRKGFKYDNLTLCGKNLEAFDLKWLDQYLGDQGMFVKRLSKTLGCTIGRRVLDPGPMFTKSTDKVVPNLKTCMDRAGVVGEVTHNALKDATDTLDCVLVALKKNDEKY